MVDSLAREGAYVTGMCPPPPAGIHLRYAQLLWSCGGHVCPNGVADWRYLEGARWDANANCLEEPAGEPPESAGSLSLTTALEGSQLSNLKRLTTASLYAVSNHSSCFRYILHYYGMRRLMRCKVGRIDARIRDRRTCSHGCR